MPGFPGVDFLDFDSLLNDEEKLVRQTRANSLTSKSCPSSKNTIVKPPSQWNWFRKLANSDFSARTSPATAAWECPTFPMDCVMQELERGDSGLRSFVSVQGALVMYPIHSYGSPAQKDKWLPKLQSGKAIGCFGLNRAAIRF